MDATERMPGDAEAAAAAEGMGDVYGRRPQIAIGDTVSFTLDGVTKSGKVDGISDGPSPGSLFYLVAADGRTWLVHDRELCGF